MYPEHQSQPTKPQSYHDYLRTRIDAVKPYWIPATVLLRELRSLGYEGRIMMLKEHIKQYKPSTPVDPMVRFETLSGEHNAAFTSAIEKFFDLTLPEVAGSLVSRITDNFSDIEAYIFKSNRYSGLFH